MGIPIPIGIPIPKVTLLVADKMLLCLNSYKKVKQTINKSQIRELRKGTQLFNSFHLMVGMSAIRHGKYLSELDAILFGNLNTPCRKITSLCYGEWRECCEHAGISHSGLPVGIGLCHCHCFA